MPFFGSSRSSSRLVAVLSFVRWCLKHIAALCLLVVHRRSFLLAHRVHSGLFTVVLDRRTRSPQALRPRCLAVRRPSQQQQHIATLSPFFCYRLISLALCLVRCLSGDCSIRSFPHNAVLRDSLPAVHWRSSTLFRTRCSACFHLC